MPRIPQNRVWVVVAMLAILLAGNLNAGLTLSAAAPKYYSVKINRVMRVRLERDLDSEHEKVGNAFSTTLVDPLYAAGGVLLAPQGSTVRGHVTNVRRAQKNGEPAVLDVAFSSLRLPNGRHLAINGSLYDLSTEGATSNNDGQLVAKKTSNRKAKFIGGGAAGGALIGAIAGGGKGLAIGAGVGALAGAITGRNKKGHEVRVKSGTEFGVIVNHAFALPAYKGAN